MFMKFSILLLVLGLGISSCANAQFFKKDPIPSEKLSLKVGASSTLVENSFHPLVGVSALTSDGTTLAGGVGAGFFHKTWDDPSKSYTTQYSAAVLLFLDTKAQLTVGAAIGFLGLFSVGYGYNFAMKAGQFITGVTFTPF